jgi:hypothetical protein
MHGNYSPKINMYYIEIVYKYNCSDFVFISAQHVLFEITNELHGNIQMNPVYLLTSQALVG